MATDRRNPSSQKDRPDGRRASDPTLTTRDIANRLGVSTDFVVGEIRDKRLWPARVIERPGGRCLYRVSEEVYRAYVKRHCWPEDASASPPPPLL
jgi:hypothetical protein